MRSIQWFALSLTAVFVLLCGCGRANRAPAALRYVTATAVYAKKVQIAPNNPTTAGGAVTAYSVNPALPAGLSLGTVSGVVSGIPTAITPKATYTVTASNRNGSTTAPLIITVNDQPPAGLSYTAGAAVYSKGAPIAANNPASTGGAITSYSVSPALPTGLSLSTSAGTVSGTPTAVTAAASYTVTASNLSGSTTAPLTIIVNPAPLSIDNLNLIFVLSGDLAYQASGDISPSTANLTGQGLGRSLLMATFLRQNVLGMKNVTAIYAIEPMTHLQTANDYPDMAAIGSIQQFAMLNQITIPTDDQGGTATANSYPLNVAYSTGPLPSGVATPLIACPACTGLDFNDEGGDNETVLKGIVKANVPGFHVFSAPWETASALLANLSSIEGYNLPLPASYAGPNYVYAISITPSGSASLSTFDSNLNPPSSYPALPSPVVSTGCPAHTAPFKIVVMGGSDGAVLPAGINTNQTFYMVRHAEAHPQSTFEDGNYVAAGQWRALDLANALSGKISPDEVMSVDPAQVGERSLGALGLQFAGYVRPSLTVEPYAVANDLPYYLAASFEILRENPPALTPQASGFLFNGGQFNNRKVLLAWEHLHIPTTVNALIASYFPNGGGQPPPKYTAPNWPDADYDTVWTVTLDAMGNVTVDNAICEGIDSAALPVTALQF